MYFVCIFGFLNSKKYVCRKGGTGMVGLRLKSYKREDSVFVAIFKNFTRARSGKIYNSLLFPNEVPREISRTHSQKLCRFRTNVALPR